MKRLVGGLNDETSENINRCGGGLAEGISRQPRDSGGAAATGGLVHPRSVHAACSDGADWADRLWKAEGAGAVASALSVNPKAKLVGVSDAFKDWAETHAAAQEEISGSGRRLR